MVAAMNFDNLVAVLAVAAAVPLILAAVPRVRVPGPVLEIVAGIVLGPAVLDLVKPDQAVRLVSTIGLAFLLFLAGLEIDVRHFRGPRALAGLALGLSALLALIIGIVLHAAGVVESPLLVGIILMATSLGLIVPILEDAGVADRPVGQFAIAGASLGEVTPVILLSLFFSGRATAIGPKLLLLSLLGVLIVLVVIATLRIERSMWITRMINRLADTSAQIRIRLSILLVVGLGALATHLGFEAILGAFIAGAILRLVDADAEHQHPAVPPETRCHRLWVPHPSLLRHQRARIQPVGAVLQRLHPAAGATVPASPAGRARTARRPLPVRPGQHPRCRRRGAAPSNVAALHRRRYHHRASVARHRAGQRRRTRRRGAFQRHPFPHHLAAVAAVVC
jgi:Sodium/hydrogen exchanger family